MVLPLRPQQLETAIRRSLLRSTESTESEILMEDPHLDAPTHPPHAQTTNKTPHIAHISLQTAMYLAPPASTQPPQQHSSNHLLSNTNKQLATTKHNTSTQQHLHSAVQPGHQYTRHTQHQQDREA